MFSITSVFRTDRGLAPAYSLAPPDIPGEHELRTPCVILSGDNFHTVRTVTVHEAASLVILSTPMGWVSVPDRMMENLEVFCRSGGTVRTVPSIVEIQDHDVQEAALLAAIHCSEIKLEHLNRVVGRLALHEIRTRPYTQEEYRAGRRVILRFDAMTEKQYMLFLYSFFAALNRLGRIAVKDRDGVRSVVFRAGSVFWRDIIITLAHIHKLRPFVRYTDSHMHVTILATDFLEFTNKVFSAGVQAQFRDFRLLTKAAAKVGIFVDERGFAHVSTQPVDKSQTPSVEQLQYRLHPYTGRAISFPEIPKDTLLEHNSMLVVTQ